jgi:hypothetical protein
LARRLGRAVSVGDVEDGGMRGVAQSKPTSKRAGIHALHASSAVEGSGSRESNNRNRISVFTRSSPENDIFFTNVNVETHKKTKSLIQKALTLLKASRTSGISAVPVGGDLSPFSRCEAAFRTNLRRRPLGTPATFISRLRKPEPGFQGTGRIGLRTLGQAALTAWAH